MVSWIRNILAAQRNAALVASVGLVTERPIDDRSSLFNALALYADKHYRMGSRNGRYFLAAEMGRDPETLLTHDELSVLRAMSEETGWPISLLASETCLPVAKVRLIVRDFHERGLADFGPLRDEDDGELRGRGYTLSDKGAKLRAQAEVTA